jgi:glycosyltransferase involved in cell wall biosynthesis
MLTDALYTVDGWPLVSIAICTYNGEQYLQEQLNSLFAQDYPHIEIIAVDDASSDKTTSILEQNAKRDGRLKVFINEKNLGYNTNFEKAINLCSGDYIAISDQDDIWEANKISLIMQHWPAGTRFVYSLSGNFTGNDLKGRTAAPGIVYSNIDDVRQLVFNSPVHGHACMFKKELALLSMPFPKDIFYDWWMSMYAAATGIIGCVPYTLTWHRVHPDNSSRMITSIKNKEERNEQLRKQVVYFIETFCSKDILSAAQQLSLLEYAGIVKQMDGKKFCWPMFRYAFKNRKIVFHYKKPKAFIFISYLKHSFKMAYKGLL